MSQKASCAKIPVLEEKIKGLGEESLVTGELLLRMSTENTALKSELDALKRSKKNISVMREGSKKRKELSELRNDLREEQKSKEELEDQLDEEIRYVETVKEAFYTVRLEFEERIGEPAQTLMPKKGGGFEEARVNDLWGE